MKVAVTGASGFLGRHVLAELSRYDVDAVAVTRNAERLLNLPPKTRVEEMDVSLLALDCFARMDCPDVLIHLAWDGLPNYKSPHHFESELPKHYQFLKNMIASGLSSVFVAGTCFEYGMQSGALSEELTPTPNNPYGYAKDALRQQVAFLKTVIPFNMIWGRLFYMYGDGQSSSSLYSQVKHAVLHNDPVLNMSGGEQLRDYLPVAEVAQTIVRLALSGSDIGTVNICSGKPVSVRRLVEQWLAENNWKMQLNLGNYPYPDYEPMAFWGDATKLQTILRSML